MVKKIIWDSQIVPDHQLVYFLNKGNLQPGEFFINNVSPTMCRVTYVKSEEELSEGRSNDKAKKDSK